MSSVAPSPPSGDAVSGEVVITYGRADELQQLRRMAETFAIGNGMTALRAGHLAIAVSELATNTLRHTAGSGQLRLWIADRSVIAEVSDSGSLPAELAGAPPVMPSQPTASGGYGLPLSAHLSDDMQVQSRPLRIRVVFRLP